MSEESALVLWFNERRGKTLKLNDRGMDIVISALKRQIPKKVKYEDVGYDNYLNVNCFSCICPNCELHIIDFNDTDVLDEYSGDDIEKMFHSSMVHHAYIGLNNYCNRCGQKLDWREK